MNYDVIEYEKKYENELMKFILDICVKEFGIDEYEQALINHVKDNEFIKTWLVVENKQIVATICYSERSNEIAEIKKLYIKESHRRNGLGKILVDKAVEHIKKCNYKSIYVGTSDHFKNAIKFYKKYGFEYIFDEGNGYIFELKL